MAFSAIFKSISAENSPFFMLFLCISASVGAYLPPLTPYTTTPCLGTPLANSQHTMQFLSRPHALALLSEGTELPTAALA
jgi:hypothetical protein